MPSNLRVPECSDSSRVPKDIYKHLPTHSAACIMAVHLFSSTASMPRRAQGDSTMSSAPSRSTHQRRHAECVGQSRVRTFFSQWYVVSEAVSSAMASAVWGPAYPSIHGIDRIPRMNSSAPHREDAHDILVIFGNRQSKRHCAVNVHRVRVRAEFEETGDYPDPGVQAACRRSFRRSLQSLVPPLASSIPETFFDGFAS